MHLEDTCFFPWKPGYHFFMLCVKGLIVVPRLLDFFLCYSVLQRRLYQWDSPPLCFPSTLHSYYQPPLPHPTVVLITSLSKHFCSWLVLADAPSVDIYSSARQNYSWCSYTQSIYWKIGRKWDYLRRVNCGEWTAACSDELCVVED